MRPGSRPRPAAARPPATAAAELVEIGCVAATHGVHGEVRMRPHNPASTTVCGVDAIVLRAPDGTCERRRLRGAHPHRRGFLLQIEGVDSAEAAAALVGRAVCVRSDQLPPLRPNEVYHAHLIGCTVRTDGGEDLGQVHEVMSTGGNDVCVVRGRGREYLIPLIADVIAQLDVAGRTIVVHPLPGLLEP